MSFYLGRVRRKWWERLYIRYKWRLSDGSIMCIYQGWYKYTLSVFNSNSKD